MPKTKQDDPVIPDQNVAKHIDLTDDTLIKVPGLDAPVKFGEWRSGFVGKSDLEKAQGEHSGYKQRVAQAVTQFLQEAQRMQAQPPGKATPTDLDELMESIKEQPFVDGQTIVRLLQKFTGPMSGGVETSQRHLGQLYKMFTEMNKSMQTLQSQLREKDLDGRVDKWLTDHNYDPSFRDYVMDMFAAYEGDPAEVFKVVEQRLDAASKGFKSKDVAALKSKQQLQQEGPKLPGRGGSIAVKTKPADLAKMSSGQSADTMWDAIHGGEGGGGDE